MGMTLGATVVAQAASTETRVPASRLIKTHIAWQGTAPVQTSQHADSDIDRGSTNSNAADLNQTIDDLFSDDSVPDSESQKPAKQQGTPQRSRDASPEELPFPPPPSAQPRTHSRSTPPPPSAPRDEKVYRLDPTKQLIAVESGQLKPGGIYFHHDDRVGRQVWSFLQADGTFWRAFGPGTTQPIERFDFGLAFDETIAELKRLDSRLAFDVTSTGSTAFLRLDDSNDWQLVRHSSVSSIMELETGRRWEKQWGRYLPVIHTTGDVWQHDGRGYHPAEQGDWCD